MTKAMKIDDAVTLAREQWADLVRTAERLDGKVASPDEVSPMKRVIATANNAATLMRNFFAEKMEWFRGVRADVPLSAITSSIMMRVDTRQPAFEPADVFRRSTAQHSLA